MNGAGNFYSLNAKHTVKTIEQGIIHILLHISCLT